MNVGAPFSFPLNAAFSDSPFRVVQRSRVQGKGTDMIVCAEARRLGVVPPPPVVGVPVDRLMKVIAVDDDDQFRRMLSDELTEYGFDVTTYSDGAALFASPSVTAAADLIVLDWSLCGADLLP